MAIIEGKKFVVGTRPSHFHVVNDGKDLIECNSPYCGDTMDLDPRQVPPIVQGREPWRGF